MLNRLQSVVLQNDLLGKIIHNFQTFQLADLLDILITAVVIYELIMLVKKTHVGQLARGIVFMLMLYLVANFSNMRTVRWVLNSILQVGFMALVVVFQPEIRRALEQVGKTSSWASDLFHMHRNDQSTRAKWQEAVVAICDAAEQLSDTKTGALIVMERYSKLTEIIRTGTPLNADVSREMLGTIFYEGTPLHDGAVVIRDGVIVAAGCVLPLSNNLDMGKDMGTRHRAGLGMSENSDAIVVVVSEETGIISMAKNGVLIRRLDRQNLFNLLQEEIVPPEETEEDNESMLKKLLRKGGNTSHAEAE